MDPPLSSSMQQALFKSRTPGLKRKSSHTFLAFKQRCKTKIWEIVTLEQCLKKVVVYVRPQGVNLLTLTWMATDLLSFVDFCWYYVPWAHIPRSARVVRVLKFVQSFLPQDSGGGDQKKYQHMYGVWVWRCAKKDPSMSTHEEMPQKVYNNPQCGIGLKLPGSITGFTSTGCIYWKSVKFFTLLSKLLAKPSCLHPSTMASADYHSGIPCHYQPRPPPDRNNSEWLWLIVVCLGAGWGAPGWPWDDDGHHGWKVCLALILLECFVCCFTWTQSPSLQKIG